MKQSFYLFVKHSEKQSEPQPEKYEKTRRIQKMLAAFSIVLLFAGGCGNQSFVLSENTLPETEDEPKISSQDNALDNAKNGDISQAASITASEAEVITVPEDIYIHICGAVKRPGVYRVAADCRLYEVILAAGGLTADADDSFVNQASALSDGMQIYIPTKEEAAQSSFLGETRSTSDEEAVQDTGLVNLNTAGLKELCTLPGIGETRAQAIIAYREKYGAFQSISELKKVNGIKDGIYEKIKDLISV